MFNYCLKLYVLINLFLICHSDCSRSLSRKVRNILENDFFNKLENIENLPENCPLHPKYDIYLQQEKHKFSESNGNMRCQYCSKVISFHFFLFFFFFFLL